MSEKEFYDDLAKQLDEELAEDLKHAKIVDEVEEEEKKVTTKSLLDDYTKLDLDKQKNNIEEAEFKEKYKEIFDAYDKILEARKSIEDKQNELKDEMLVKMREANQKDEFNERFKVHYTAPSVRKSFDTKQFYEDYAEDTAMYKKYVKTTSVKDGIKISEVKNK